MLTATHPYLITPTRYIDDEPATWPVSVCGPGGEFLGQTDYGTSTGSTTYKGRRYHLLPCDHAPHWTYLVPVWEQFTRVTDGTHTYLVSQDLGAQVFVAMVGDPAPGNRYYLRKIDLREVEGGAA